MKIIFRAGATYLLEELIERFNKENNLDVTIEVDENDEVNKVILSAKKLSVSQAFSLGLKYGMLVENERAKGNQLL
jgi:hypothetical protein